MSILLLPQTRNVVINSGWNSVSKTRIVICFLVLVFDLFLNLVSHLGPFHRYWRFSSVPVSDSNYQQNTGNNATLVTKIWGWKKMAVGAKEKNLSQTKQWCLIFIWLPCSSRHTVYLHKYSPFFLSTTLRKMWLRMQNFKNSTEKDEQVQLYSSVEEGRCEILIHLIIALLVAFLTVVRHRTPVSLF